MFKKTISLFLSLSFLLQQTVFAYTASLNLSGYLNQVPNLTVSDRFRPISLRYFSYQPLTNDFKILLDKGDYQEPSLHLRGAGGVDVLKQEAGILLDYFKIGLSLPNDKFWVNLRPDSEDQIIDEELAKTDLGKVMLEADLKLKQDTALFTSPQTPQGKEYWNKLYQKAGELFGTENITIPTITRPWIVPGEIILRESSDNNSTTSQGAYIYKANLKVMLEEDYLTSRGGFEPAPTTYQQYEFNDPRLKELNQYSTQLIRELILPKLTQKVNSSKDYANLRQVYFSLILARWFKESFRSQRTENREQRTDKTNNYVNLIDSKNLSNLTSKQAWDKTTYFKAYQKSFNEGEYNLSESVYTPTGQVIRRYMSGGVNIMSGSPLEGRFWGNLKEFYWFAKLMSKTMVALFARGNRDTAVKAMDEFNAHFVSDLSTVDQNMLNAGLTNIFDGSIAIEKIEGTIDDIYESDPDFAWDFPDRVKNFIKKFAKSQDKEEFLKDKTISALENRLSKEETGCLLTIWNAYYKYIANEINSRLQSTNSYEEDFSTIRRVLESAKFKDTKLGKEFASAWHKSDFIKNIIHLNVNNEKREMEELSILSHAWREIAKETSHEGYLTSEKAGKISDEYINEMRKYGNLLRDFIAQNSYYFNEYTISRTEDLLKNDRTKEAATEAFRAINNLHYTYTLRYSAWIKTYSFYYSKRIRFSEYLNEIGKLSDEIKETLSDLPLFPKESDIPTGKKIQEDKWGAAKESLNTVDKELRILENKKTIFEFLKELPSATTYLYARAVTTKEKTQLNKLKEEIRNFIDKSLGFRWSDMKEVERYLTKGEPRHIILATIKIGLMYAKEAGVESKEFHKWQSKAQTLAKQFQVPIVSSALAIEQYKELIEQVFSNYESGGRKLPEYLQTARDEIQGLFSHSSLHKLLTDTAVLIRQNEPQLKTMGTIYLALINSAKAIEDDIFGSPQHLFNPATLSTSGDKVSSALVATAPIKTGGIDFREMSILSKPMGNFSGLDFNLPMLSKAELESFNLDAESADIQKMVNSGIVPSGNRLKEYLWACHQKGELDSRREGIILSLVKICGLEESLAKESDPALREALVMAEWI